MKENTKWFLYLGILLFVAYTFVDIIYKNEVPADSGDGLMHFFISQGGFEKPSLFLDHWGKPLFSLLASPFAYFGFETFAWFNVVVFIATCILAKRLFDRLNVPFALQLLFPLILVSANDLVITVVGGLTEPLFNLFLMWSMLLLLKRKWLLFAIIISFMPYLRSEGQLPVIIGLLLLIYYKQYKTIPFLLTGFIVYAMIGMVALGDFLWYFNASPYDMSNTIYGFGTWDHYLLSYRNYLGNPGVYLLILSLPIVIYLLIKQAWSVLHFDLLLLGAGVFLGIIISHSYFWATGQNGSLGLTRIATQGMPVFVLLMLYFIGTVRPFQSKYFFPIALIGVFFMGSSFMNNTRFPVKMSNLERLVLKAAEYVKEDGSHSYYHFPLYGYALGCNPLSNENADHQHYSGNTLEEDVKSKFKEGELLVWDSHFGPQEAQLPLERIQSLNEFTLIKEYISGFDSVRIFRFSKREKNRLNNEGNVHLGEDLNLQIDKTDEFVNIDLFDEKLQPNTKLIFTPDSKGTNFRLVFDNGVSDEYFSVDLSTLKESDEISFIVPESGNYKLYVWNPDHYKGTVFIKNIKLMKRL